MRVTQKHQLATYFFKFLFNSIWIFFICLIVSPPQSYSFSRSRRTDAATNLLQAFSAGCKSYGTWASAAITHTQALEATIKHLQDNDNCNLGTALSTAQNLSEEMLRLSRSPNEISLVEAQQTKLQLLLQFQTTQDPILKASISSLIAQADFTLAQANGAVKAERDASTKQSLVRGLTQSSSYLNTLLTNPNLAHCIINDPTLGFQLAAQSIGLAGTFSNSTIGPAISATGQIMSLLLGVLRGLSYKKMLWKLKTTEMAPALACALESMTEAYCNADDQNALSELQAQNHLRQWETTPFWEGLNLLSNKIPTLMLWISKVASGVKPSSTFNAERQNQAWAKVQLLAATQRTTQGIIQQTRQAIQLAPDTLIPQIRLMLVKLIDAMIGGSTQPASPLKDIYPTRSHLLYRLLGKPLDCNPTATSNDCKDEQSIDLPSDGLNSISSNATILIREADKLALADLHLVIEFDPSGLLREATLSNTPGASTPIEILKDLLSFLNTSEKYAKRHPPNSIYLSQLLFTIADTRTLLTNVIELIDRSPNTRQDDQDVFHQLFQQLNLFNGTDFLHDRLLRHIKWDISNRIQNGAIPRNIEEILLASGLSATDEFDANGVGNIDRLMDDISTAKSISQQNIKNFIEFFSSGFTGVLKNLHLFADAAGELENDPNRRTITRLCLLLASGSTQWPKGIHPALCTGVELKSVYPRFQETLTFAELKSSLDRKDPLKTHMCAYRNFIRRSFLFGHTKPIIAPPVTPFTGLIRTSFETAI
jgi:hypothetical protein